MLSVTPFIADDNNHVFTRLFYAGNCVAFVFILKRKNDIRIRYIFFWFRRIFLPFFAFLPSLSFSYFVSGYDVLIINTLFSFDLCMTPDNSWERNDI